MLGRAVVNLSRTLWKIWLGRGCEGLMRCVAEKWRKGMSPCTLMANMEFYNRPSKMVCSAKKQLSPRGSWWKKLGGVYMILVRLSFWYEFNPVPSCGSVFVYMIPTGTKSHTGTSHTSASSPRSLYRGENSFRCCVNIPSCKHGIKSQCHPSMKLALVRVSHVNAPLVDVNCTAIYCLYSVAADTFERAG